MHLDMPNGTALDIFCPTKGEIEAFIAENNSIRDKLSTAKDAEETAKLINRLYAMAATLISHNTDDLTVTDDELRARYLIEEDALLAFYGAYADFILDIVNEKN